MKVVFLGAGNLATNLAKNLFHKGFRITQIYSRTEFSAQALAQQVDASFTTTLASVDESADLYIYALKDDVLPQIISQMPVKRGLHVHTAGSVPMSVFESWQNDFGVFYPLQTFSKQKDVDFGRIPIFVEGNSFESESHLKEVARLLSTAVFASSSAERCKIHLSAVFACNFTNLMFQIADRLLGEVPFDVLLPLVQETVNKVKSFSPKDVQTGPAKRNDLVVIQKHLETLKDDADLQEIYRKLTVFIQKA